MTTATGAGRKQRSGSAAQASRARSHPKPERHGKVAITVPERLLQAARARVERGEQPSLSAVFTRALARDLEDDSAFDRLVENMLANGELTITDEDEAWARRALAR